MRRSVRLRRALSLWVLVALSVAASEAVAAPAGDGAVHHESTVVAAEHRAEQGVEHQHLNEDPLSAAGGTSDPVSGGAPQHDHPGGADHCMHLHGVGIPLSFSMVFDTPTSRLPAAGPEHHDSAVRTSLRRPPRA